MGFKPLWVGRGKIAIAAIFIFLGLLVETILHFLLWKKHPGVFIVISLILLWLIIRYVYQIYRK